MKKKFLCLVLMIVFSIACLIIFTDVAYNNPSFDSYSNRYDVKKYITISVVSFFR